MKSARKTARPRMVRVVNPDSSTDWWMPHWLLTQNVFELDRYVSTVNATTADSSPMMSSTLMPLGNGPLAQSEAHCVPSWRRGGLSTTRSLPTRKSSWRRGWRRISGSSASDTPMRSPGTPMLPPATRPPGGLPVAVQRQWMMLTTEIVSLLHSRPRPARSMTGSTE